MFHQKNFFHISQSPNLQNEKMTLDRLLINLIVGFVKRIKGSVLLAGDNRGASLANARHVRQVKKRYTPQICFGGDCSSSMLYLEKNHTK